MLWWMALRNLGRNLRRTALVVAAIALGTGLAITMSSFQHGVWSSVLTTAIGTASGHVVVQAKGWQAERDPALVVPGSQGVADQLGAAFPGAAVLRRVNLGGLLTSPHGQTAVGVRGLEPAEVDVSTLDDRLVEGTWLPDGDREAALIGDDLARQLRVGVGDKMVLMVQVGDADMESVLLRVRGIWHTGGEAMDAFTLIVPFGTVQPVLPGDDPASQVAVVLPGESLEAPDTMALAAALPGLDVLTWQQSMPMMHEQAMMKERSGAVMSGLLLVIIAVGVLNTVLMGMMERVREFGVVLSVGLTPGNLGKLVLIEGFWIGVLGCLASMAFVGMTWWPLYVHGVDYGDLMGDALPIGAAYEQVMRARFDPLSTVVWFFVAVLMTVLASVWPAWQATRLQPVEAMRHV